MVICNRTKNNKREMLYPNIMLDIQGYCFYVQALTNIIVILINYYLLE
jgi:hypothetical protein